MQQCGNSCDVSVKPVQMSTALVFTGFPSFLTLQREAGWGRWEGAMSPPSRGGQLWGKCQAGPWEDRLLLQSTLILGEGCVLLLLVVLREHQFAIIPFSGLSTEEGFGRGGVLFLQHLLKLRPAQGHRPGAITLGQSLAGASISNFWAHLAMCFQESVLSQLSPQVRGWGRYCGQHLSEAEMVREGKGDQTTHAIQGLRQCGLHPLVMVSSLFHTCLPKGILGEEQ